MRLGRPLNLSDAPDHPSFSYRPETGEDPYHAFLAAPLLRGGRTIGVLVVQNRTTRVYTEEEVEDLQIIAMVLSEMVAGGELGGQDALKDVQIAPNRPDHLKGTRFAEGLAYGEAVLHEAPVIVEQLLSDDAVREEARLKTAIAALHKQLDDMLDGQHGIVGPSLDVLETYRMFAHDRGWNRSLEEAVRSGLTAEAAVERVRSEHRARLGQARDPYLRERLHDLEDLNDRLLRHLSGDGGASARRLPDNAILIARNLGPADLLEYDRTKLRGLLLEEGSSASHAAIIARALDIPCVGRLAGLRDRVNQGDPVIVDAETGEAYLRPRPDVIEAVQARMEVRAQRRAEFARLRDTPRLHPRRGQDHPADERRPRRRHRHPARDRGRGIGLFRTEFQFMVAEELPRLEAQTALYERILEGAGDLPVTFRTLDLGGDKVLPYLEAERRGEPGAGLARRASGAGPSRPAAPAAAGPDLRGARPRTAGHVPPGGQRRGIPQGARPGRPRGGLGPAPRPARAVPAARRHHDRGAVAALAPGRAFADDGLRLGRHQRPDAVPVRRRPRKPKGFRPLRLPFATGPEGDEDHRRRLRRNGHPGFGVRGDGRPPAGGLRPGGPGFDRLSMPPSGIGPVKRMVLSCDREAARRGVLNLLKGSSGSVRSEIETLARKLYVAV